MQLILILWNGFSLSAVSSIYLILQLKFVIIDTHPAANVRSICINISATSHVLDCRHYCIQYKWFLYIIIHNHSIIFDQIIINDDYCDDMIYGMDEYMTEACSHLHTNFDCGLDKNNLYQFIKSSRVNDGIVMLLLFHLSFIYIYMYIIYIYTIYIVYIYKFIRIYCFNSSNATLQEYVIVAMERMNIRISLAALIHVVS